MSLQQPRSLARNLLRFFLWQPLCRGGGCAPGPLASQGDVQVGPAQGTGTAGPETGHVWPAEARSAHRPQALTSRGSHSGKEMTPGDPVMATQKTGHPRQPRDDIEIHPSRHSVIHFQRWPNLRYTEKRKLYLKISFCKEPECL